MCEERKQIIFWTTPTSSPTTSNCDLSKDPAAQYSFSKETRRASERSPRPAHYFPPGDHHLTKPANKENCTESSGPPFSVETE